MFPCETTSTQGSLRTLRLEVYGWIHGQERRFHTTYAQFPNLLLGLFPVLILLILIDECSAPRRGEPPRNYRQQSPAGASALSRGLRQTFRERCTRAPPVSLMCNTTDLT